MPSCFRIQLGSRGGAAVRNRDSGSISQLSGESEHVPDLEARSGPAGAAEIALAPAELALDVPPGAPGLENGGVEKLEDPPGLLLSSPGPGVPFASFESVLSMIMVYMILQQGRIERHCGA